MTRSLEKPKDHPHHKGLWFSVDEVNGIKFWAERGTIENVSVEPIVAKGNPARFKVVNHWLGKDGQPILIESTTISIDANRVIDLRRGSVGGKRPRHVSATQKRACSASALPIRCAKAVGGKVVSAEGVHGSHECWGKPSAWIDYDGMVDGKLVGVAIFDNPHNFRPLAVSRPRLRAVLDQPVRRKRLHRTARTPRLP